MGGSQRCGLFTWTACISGKIVPCRRLSDHGGWHAGHNGLICGADHEAIALAMLTYLQKHFRAWDTLEVVDLIQDSVSHQALLRACAKLDLLVTAHPGKRSPYLQITQDWDSYLRTRNSKFRNSLDRNERALNRIGQVNIRFLSGIEIVQSGLEEVMAIERQSWKQQARSAITARDWERSFYEAYVPRAAECGAVSLAIMQVDGRPVSYDMGLIQGGRYSSLKTSYVDDIKAVAPGKIMIAHVIRFLMEQRLEEYDFLGDAVDYKLAWTDTVRPHVSLQIYRNRLYAEVVDRLRDAPSPVWRETHEAGARNRGGEK